MLHKSKVISGAARYIDEEILSKLKGSIAFWGLGVAAGIVMQDAERTLNALINHPIAKFYNLSDGELIDVDRLYGLLHNMAEKSTATINIKILGPLTLTTEDVEKLYRYIREA